jgi:hypothetical protein
VILPWHARVRAEIPVLARALSRNFERVGAPSGTRAGITGLGPPPDLGRLSGLPAARVVRQSAMTLPGSTVRALGPSIGSASPSRWEALAWCYRQLKAATGQMER